MSLERHSLLTERTQRSERRYWDCAEEVAALHTASRQGLAEFSAEFRVAVVEHVPLFLQLPRLLVNRVAGNLRHPLLGWMARNAGQSDTPGLEMQQEQAVVGDQATPSQHFHGEKINPRENRHVRGDELLPSRALALFRRWRDAITAQDIPHSVIGDNVTKIGQWPTIRS
jgi:hypothetical protein